ncbi:hypothetical protein L208DRAFT_1299891 [Tricholoma matsutake]|nr:hypothetical protein L208DRAFT_1299891 [Tricholoma matsutake 945]
MQCRLSARQTRWMEYLSQFDFDIQYIKGNLNKVVDALSQYYQFDNWDEAPLVQHYVFADVRLDPKHEDLPWERHLEIKNWMADHPEEGDVSPAPDRGYNPMIYDSLASGTDLMVHLSDPDPWDEDIWVGYAQDKLFSKIMKQPGDHPGFEVSDGLVWMKNRGGVRVLCVPSPLRIVPCTDE